MRTASSSSSTALFEPPPTNSYHGTPVYDNITMSSSSTSNITDLLASVQRNADHDAVFVVSGASRGIGLQYCRSLLSRTRGTVVACARDPNNAPLLQELSKANFPRLQILPLDVTDQDQIESVASQLESQFNRVDVLLNVAGILGDGGTSTPGPERNLSQIDREWITKNMDVNAISPMLLSKALSPMMKSKKGKTMLRAAPSIIVNMSARVGSISDTNRAGIAWHSYRMSKAALNMGTRILSHELKRQGTWTISLYPGFTDTDLSKPFQRGMREGMIFPVEFTVGRMLNVVDGMEERHSGGLYDWAGQALPF